MSNEERLAALEERIVSHDRRISRNEDLITSIHELKVIVETLANKMDRYTDSVDARLKVQGERLGEIEKRGSKKLENVGATIVTVVITAIIMYFAARLGM